MDRISREEVIESLEEMQHSKKLCFHINQTEPYTKEQRDLIEQLFEGRLDKSSIVCAPMDIDFAGRVTIGKNVFINHNLNTMARGGIVIEDDVKIALGVSLITVNHDFHEREILLCSPIIIKKNAWIGANAIILPGVTIGENAIVGAGAVVTKDVKANTVVGGNPAKYIKNID